LSSRSATQRITASIAEIRSSWTAKRSSIALMPCSIAPNRSFECGEPMERSHAALQAVKAMAKAVHLGSQRQNTVPRSSKLIFS